MDEIIPGLWVGDMRSALDVENLRANNIRSIVSAMRGRISINPTFLRYQINLDDDEATDILVHLVPAISFIQTERDKGRGVLIHCQAGISRSATIAAAYLMYAKNLDATAALDIIRKARPHAQPNDGFIMQLEIFYETSFKVSRRDKETRMFYLERAVAEMMNGDGEIDTEMFAKYPRTPSDSVPPTPGGLHRRIRCKMCRTELARREHMMDHGQIGPPTPAFAIGLSPAVSRRPSSTADQHPLHRRLSGNDHVPSRRQSGTQPRSRLGSGSDLPPPRRQGSLANERLGRVSDQFSATAAEDNSVFEDDSADEEVTQPTSSDGTITQPRSRTGSANGFHPNRLSQLDGPPMARGLSDSLAMSTIDDHPSPKAVETVSVVEGAPPTPPRSRLGSGSGSRTRPSFAGQTGVALGRSISHSLEVSEMESALDDETDAPPITSTLPTMSRRSSAPRQPSLPFISETGPLSIQSSVSENHSQEPDATQQPSSSDTSLPRTSRPSLGGQFSHPSDLAAQLFANPKLAALRSPMAMTPMTQTPSVKPTQPIPAPILINAKCSGYFLEPMKWMEHFLEQGQLAGKIVCPNKKCGAKLGNYDWAGVCCSCKEWVTPGFCIHRSKVDEIV
ncbi:hypothetical protein JAAARDRAFT_34319 [Jaapia argillacea MUCL 33604]|uniref:protein-tyrosine-phosphatase n=1 Tax=Jaapia argillacea MUCL 33604 TaxID=933084 RepID=A0A067Q7D3_9AGAM|nr:hypothetical protein JAAARDRAFT_34319 [Jaapia argillacea MUCL 33604]